MNDKLDKLIDILTWYINTQGDVKYFIEKLVKLKEEPDRDTNVPIKTDEIKPDVAPVQQIDKNVAENKFDGTDSLGLAQYQSKINQDVTKSEEIKPDVTTSEEITREAYDMHNIAGKHKSETCKFCKAKREGRLV